MLCAYALAMHALAQDGTGAVCYATCLCAHSPHAFAPTGILRHTACKQRPLCMNDPINPALWQARTLTGAHTPACCFVCVRDPGACTRVPHWLPHPYKPRNKHRVCLSGLWDASPPCICRQGPECCMLQKTPHLRVHACCVCCAGAQARFLAPATIYLLAACRERRPTCACVRAACTVQVLRHDPREQNLEMHPGSSMHKDPLSRGNYNRLVGMLPLSKGAYLLRVRVPACVRIFRSLTCLCVVPGRPCTRAARSSLYDLDT